jgi:hypothetical protein
MASTQTWTIVLCFVIFTGQPSYTQCISTGARNAGTSASVAYPGSNFSFTNVSGVSLSDDTRATSFALVSVLSGQTQFLQATNFGFTIPSTAVICGITVEVEKSASGIGLFTDVVDRDVYIIKNGARTGTNKANGAEWTGSDAYTAYGGASDNWGTTWLPSDINASDFGIAIAADINGLIGLVPVARIDHIRITVHYYEPPLLSSAVTGFEVGMVHDKVRLRWHSDGVKFLVQRSADNSHWETLGTVYQYSFIDADPLPGKSYYRLVVEDASGAQIYSFSKSLLLPAQPSIQCFPNPFTGSLYISGAGGQQVRLRDVYGQVVDLGQGSRHDVSHLPPGIYFVCIGQWTKKVVKL